MVYKNHNIQLYVNGKLVDFESQEDVDIRFNSILFDPTKINTTQAEYSFEFELPCTANNNKIFEYANNFSKLNKFHRRFDAELYADGTLIFKGTLTLNEVQNKRYNVNLVEVKRYTLSDIFGDSTLTDIPWYIPFNGAGLSSNTIDTYNANPSEGVMFPLVSYGVFIKDPYNQDETAKDFTSLYDIDKYNKWWQDSFSPSLNMIELMKKAFEWKGYTVQGDALTDYFLKDIYMSENLAQNQSPTYNLGNEKFGACHITVGWRSYNSSTGEFFGAPTQDLNYKLFKANEPWVDDDDITHDTEWNWDKIKVYDMMNPNEGGNVNSFSESYLYQPNENCIVIPADGYYEISMYLAGANLLQYNKLRAKQWIRPSIGNLLLSQGAFEADIDFSPNFKITCPLEIQLVKMADIEDDNQVQLIHGVNYTRIFDGYPDNETVGGGGSQNNYVDVEGLIPHEICGSDPTAPHPDIDFSWFQNNNINYSAVGKDKYPSQTYLPVDVLAYDPMVNPNFICGFSSIGSKTKGNGTAAIIKNGYSWAPTYHSEKHESLYKASGYQGMDLKWNISQTEKIPFIYPTDYQKNEYPNSPSNWCTLNDRLLQGEIHCLVKLNKNDILKMYAIHRDYTNMEGYKVDYSTDAIVSLDIRALTPNNMAYIKQKNIGYGNESEFDKDLKVTNFLNKETKVSDWIQQCCDAFNLQLQQNGKTITISTNKLTAAIDDPSVINIDDRVNSEASDGVKSEVIDYPRSMAVKYKINTGEHGFYDSVPPEHLEQEDWKDYGDSGFTTIMLNDDSYVTNEVNKNLQFSYTWYDDFYWFGESSERASGGTPDVIRIPVISNESDMIDAPTMQYKAQVKDGKSLPQRFWFKPKLANLMVHTVDTNERIVVYLPQNEKDGLNLSYKLSERSLLKQYFNTEAHLSSNYIEVDVYITPNEYNRIKNGAYVRFDSDLYKVCSIDGYDPSGNDPTTLKLMKKVTS